MVDLAARFLSQLPAAKRPVFQAIGDLSARLSTLAEEARAAYPTIDFDEKAFVDALASRAEDDLDSLRAADVHLAVACARGDENAIAVFDRLFATEIDAAIAKSPRLGVTKDEFRQLVRTKLFVGEKGKPARVASYGGRGPLKAWVRVTVARLVVDLSRAHAEAEESADDALLDRVAAPHDPETQILRAAYGAHVPEAFREALQNLSVRQRNLLRQRYLHGLNADKLAPIYGVHRATAFGWLEEARKALMTNVREALRARIPGTELESVVGVLGSKLEVSVRGALGASMEEEK